jgi:hypothetical protein
MVGSPTDLEVGAEGVKPGDLSSASATLLGRLAPSAAPAQHRDFGSNSSGYILGCPRRSTEGEPQYAKSRELAMAVKFDEERVVFERSTGPVSRNEEVTFERKVQKANAAIKAFKLDYVGGTRETDISEVSISNVNPSHATVEFTVTVNYSGGEFTGEVVVLVIAEIEDHP